MATPEEDFIPNGIYAYSAGVGNGVDDRMFEVDHGSVAVWKGVCSTPPDDGHDCNPFIVLSAIAVKHGDNPEDYRVEMTLDAERGQELLAQLTGALAREAV